VIFHDTEVPGAYLIELEKIEDERGFFARAFCQNEFGRVGLSAQFAQCNICFNRRRGTLRGMHWQAAPHGEARLVRCIRGAAYDVLLDLRRNSPGFGKWMSVELTAENRSAVHIPEGVAHGFQTLADDTEMLYQMSEFYEPTHARGVRWDDPSFRIKWPVQNPILSEHDRSHALWV
jgi:dTDP-4-dehydrorhamnose 3,5-epimerase